MASNGVLFQAFHWFTKDDGRHWLELRDMASELRDRGFTAVWIPPCYKGADGASDTGYAVYDLFDLGEFEQKGSIRTKYGTRAELLEAIQALRKADLEVYADIVLNHRCGADETEEVDAVEVMKHDRNHVCSGSFRMKAWTKFTFPGRGGRYSDFEWNSSCFTSVDTNADAPSEDKVYLLNGKTFSGEVSFEFGNFDFLMGCDLDLYSEPVREELFRWAQWLVEETGVNGFRLDAVKHIPASFYNEFFERLRQRFEGHELLGIGEYWSPRVEELQRYLHDIGGVMKLFDVPLHFRFVEAAERGREFDLRTIFSGTLMEADSVSAVTFVDNHDTQPTQSLESPVADWFKPLAYALILLRKEGYPCVFYADYLGVDQEDCKLACHRHLIDSMLSARQRYHYGDQHDYFDDPNCIGWIRTGDEAHPGSIVVVMSTADGSQKRINACAANANFRDITEHISDIITTDAEGYADFPCPAGSLSVWVQE